MQRFLVAGSTLQILHLSPRCRATACLRTRATTSCTSLLPRWNSICGINSSDNPTTKQPPYLPRVVVPILKDDEETDDSLKVVKRFKKAHVDWPATATQVNDWSHCLRNGNTMKVDVTFRFASTRCRKSGNLRRPTRT